MRGRDAIAVAFRSPEGSIVWQTERLDAGFHGSRWAKLPFVRGLVVLYETLIVGTRWLVRSASLAASEEGVELGRRRDRHHARDHPRRRDRDLLPAAARDRHGDHEPDRQRPRPAPRRGPDPGRDLPRLPAAHRPGEGRPARLPVPRRRAHDDPRPGGGRSADHCRGPQVPDRPPALRDRVPRRRDRTVDPAVQPGRPADPAGHGRQPDPAHPGHRRRRLRAAPARGALSGQPGRPGDHDARASGSRRSRPASRPTT